MGDLGLKSLCTHCITYDQSVNNKQYNIVLHLILQYIVHFGGLWAKLAEVGI